MNRKKGRVKARIPLPKHPPLRVPDKKKAALVPDAYFPPTSGISFDEYADITLDDGDPALLEVFKNLTEVKK